MDGEMDNLPEEVHGLEDVEELPGEGQVTREIVGMEEPVMYEIIQQIDFPTESLMMALGFITGLLMVLIASGGMRNST